MALDTRWKLPQGKTPEHLYSWAEQVIRELRKGDYLPTVLSAAEDIAYDNATSGLTADDVQAAIDEVEDRVDTLEAIPSPGKVLLASGTISSPQATLDILLTSYTAYRLIEIHLDGIVPETDDRELWARLSSDGGSNYDANASDYAWSLMLVHSGSATGVPVVDAADAQIKVAANTVATQSVSNVASDGGANLIVRLYGRTDGGRRTGVEFVGGWVSAADTTAQVHGFGVRLASQDTDAIRFLFETDDIASAKWAVYGYA